VDPITSWPHSSTARTPVQRAFGIVWHIRSTSAVDPYLLWFTGAEQVQVGLFITVTDVMAPLSA
jgi:hypothetical protein